MALVSGGTTYKCAYTCARLEPNGTSRATSNTDFHVPSTFHPSSMAPQVYGGQCVESHLGTRHLPHASPQPCTKALLVMLSHDIDVQSRRKPSRKTIPTSRHFPWRAHFLPIRAPRCKTTLARGGKRLAPCCQHPPHTAVRLHHQPQAGVGRDPHGATAAHSINIY
jgi:hypothetical protein